MDQVAEQQNTQVIVREDTSAVLSIIERVAMDPAADIDKLERMLAMQERLVARDAKAAYDAAMADLQENLPVITKAGEIKNKSGQTASKYAEYDDIMAAIKPLLKQHGFSITFKPETVDDKVRVTGIVSHKGGHQESTAITLPFDNSGFKNDVQGFGSSASYAKRYALIMLLNIVTSEGDDDGQAGGGGQNAHYARLMDHNNAVRDCLPTILCIKESLAMQPPDLSAAKEAWSELDEETQRALWLATTKGGIFTTFERQTIKSDAWYQT